MKSLQNLQINRDLCNVMAAVHHLDQHGCEVLSVEFTGRNPRLHIHTPSAVFLQGARIGRTVRDGMERVICAARVHECQVQWQQTRRVEDSACV